MLPSSRNDTARRDCSVTTSIASGTNQRHRSARARTISLSFSIIGAGIIGSAVSQTAQPSTCFQRMPWKLDWAVRQIVSRAVSSDKVIDIFDAAGLKKPDISILSEEFLAEVKQLPQRNLAVELLQKLLNNEPKIRSKKYLVQSCSFAEMLEATSFRSPGSLRLRSLVN